MREFLARRLNFGGPVESQETVYYYCRANLDADSTLVAQSVVGSYLSVSSVGFFECFRGRNLGSQDSLIRC